MAGGDGCPRRLVLVGQGHCHLLVMEALARRPLAGADLVWIVDGTEALYSGMVPGCIAGRYRIDEVAVPLAPLARRAGARLVISRARRISGAVRVVETAAGERVGFDVASIDVGSTVAGHDVPGVPEHAVPTRPISRLLEALPPALAKAAASEHPAHALVAGGGAAGVELALAVRARLQGEGQAAPRVTLLEAGAQLLPGQPPRVVRAVLRALRRRQVTVATGARIVRAGPDGVTLDDGRTLGCDVLVWATGAAAHPLARRSGLPCDDAGFVRAHPTLEVVGHPGLFVAGDAAALDHAPGLPRAGVHAVRAAPVLAENLRAALTGGRLRPFRPQRHFLVLLNLGDGRAIAVRNGRALAGRIPWWLKDAIDRRFVARFRRAEPTAQS